MKAVIRFTKPDNKLAILTKFLDIIQGVSQLREHVLTHGILFEPLSKSELAALINALAGLKYSDYITTDHSLRLKIANGEFRSILILVIPIPFVRNDFAERFWEKGFIIDNLPADQASALQGLLEAIATVVIVPDTIEPSQSLIYTVSGQVLHPDGKPFTESGYTVRAFNAEAPLGNAASIHSNGDYSISYPWKFDGGNGPDLVVQLFNPENMVVTHHRKPDAKIKETLNLTVKQIGPRTFTLTGFVKNQTTGAVLSDLQVEAQFRAKNDLLLTRSGNTNEDGVVSFPFDESIFGKLPVEVIFLVSQEGQSLDTITTIKSLKPGDQEVEILVTVPDPSCEIFVVSGKIEREDGLLLQDLRVYAAHEMKQGLIRLGEGVTDAQGRYTIRYKSLPKVKAIDLHITVANEDGKLLQSSDIILNAKPLEIVDLVIPVTGNIGTARRIEGIIMLEHGMPANKLKLRLYRRDFGGKTTFLAETNSLTGGQYAFTYDSGGQAQSLEVRAVDHSDKEVVLSKPLNNLSYESPVVLNLIAPSNLQSLGAEYHRMVADLTTHIGQMTALAQAKEDEGHQDLTVLNRVTGWDARLIALAAMTERLAADADVKLPQEPLYGLLRVGLPSNKLLLAQVGSDTAVRALIKARDTGIVDLSDQQIDQFKQQFVTFANAVHLNLSAPGSHSTYANLLKASGLPADVQNKFASIYLNQRGDATQLWEEARNAGLNETQISRLQLQGKLAFLAGNSEEITTRLLQRQISDPVQLVEQDYYRAETWVAEILGQAEIPVDRLTELTDTDRQKLEKLIPVAYAAEKVEDRLSAYTEDMARKIRLSYPTQVVNRLIESDEKYKLPAAHDATVTLLKNAVAHGFRLGETPVAAFLKTHSNIIAGIASPDTQAAQQQLHTLQRIYQITPSDEAIPVLMSLNLTSAFDVMAYPEEQFIAIFNWRYAEIYKKPAPQDTATLISRKAKQVSSIIYNVFATAKKLESDLPVTGISAPVQVRESVKNELIKQFPTMESLFGSMDFCECEHCRSILSPAAYLVDLLQFIDPEPDEWENFLTYWKSTHSNQTYPHQNADGWPLKPYEVLVERRPDLPHIALTCENTHTAMPYIDIVNEVLEYYVAHGKLADDAAHDTGEATTAELLAEPQNVIREAYSKLGQASYPLTMPFDLWIETVRKFCDYFETPLHQLLEVFRPSDSLFAPWQSFDRAAIFMESLGLSPAEVAIFTNPDPLERWYELYGFTNKEEAITEAVDSTGQRIGLNSAKALARRLGVTYKEITEIVQTGFVNPELNKLSLLYKLGVSVGDARLYRDYKAFYEQNQDLVGQERSVLQPADQQRFDELAHKIPDTPFTGWEIVNELAEFEQRLKNLADEFNISLDDLQTDIQAIPFDRVLVLADPDAGCNFDQTILRYADGTQTDAIVFLRINLFVRLWRKLGWSIEETDRALTTFIPQSAPFDGMAANLEKQPLQTALIYLAHLKVLDEKLKVAKQNRLALLTLWSDIPTTGKQPLYAQLFLTRSILRNAPVFDHPLGQYLTDTDVKLKDHVLALQGALGLTADEIGRVLADAGRSLDTAELSLLNVSLLYRYGLLAKGLKLSVRELIVLKQLSGLDPFRGLHPDPLAAIDQDHPFSQTLKFVEMVEEVRESGLKIEDLDYLLRHRFDETGKYRPNSEGTLTLLKTLAEGIRAIRAEHAVPDDPGTMSDEVLRQKLGLILPAGTLAVFLAMMEGTAEFSVSRDNADQLHMADFSGESAIVRLTYNAVTREQALVFRGVLFDLQKEELKARFNTKLEPAQQGVLAALLDAVQTEAEAFFVTHLQQQPLNESVTTGFLDTSDYELLFAPVSADLPEEQRQEHDRQRRTLLVQAFLPILQRRLIRQFIVQTMVAYTGADPALVESLVTDERLLTAVDSSSLLTSFASVGERGVSAVFSSSDDLSDISGATGTVVRSADVSLGDLPDPVNSARFEGYLEVPVSGVYRFYVELGGQDVEAELRFPHLPDPVFLKDRLLDKFLELKVGTLYRFMLDLKKLDGGAARLLVQGETLPKGPVSQLALYPVAAIDTAERATILLNKSLQLVQSLGLSEREIRYLLTHADNFNGINLSELPTVSDVDTTTGQQAMVERFGWFLRLAAYARLKRDLATGNDDLIGIFEADGTTAANRLEEQIYPRIAKLTRRDEATIQATTEALFTVSDFVSEEPLQRLWEALQVVERFGVPVASLLDWTHIVSSTIASEQRFEIARDLKEAIKARFEPENWQRVAQPIFNNLRQHQRDALVSHVLQQLRTKLETAHIDTQEKLYEYFLIDPGMEPVVQTSRIRLAISSVQLFIQRCLLNLEPKVQPSTINAKHWEWMRRYRPWEANRKIFLFPENWLEPEFRDDKTHLFSELEGTLLQGDVSSDLVEDAFLNYLKKLDELARLDIVAMHIEDSHDPTLRILHVFGRTYSQPHQYFYRCYAGQMWTPWEPVTAEVTGDHLAPVVWRDRLYLFWVTFMDKPIENPVPTPDNANTRLTNLTLGNAISSMLGMAAQKNIEVQLHWSEYLQGKWNTRQSSQFFSVGSRWGDDRVSVSHPFPFNYDLKRVFIHVSKETYNRDGQESVLFVHLRGPEFFEHNFYITGRNSGVGIGEDYAAKPKNPYGGDESVTQYSSNGALIVNARRRISTETENREEPLTILQRSIGSYKLLPCNNNLTTVGSSDFDDISSLIKPVFYQDSQHTFFIEPSATEQTIEEWQEWVARPPQPESEPAIPEIEPYVRVPKLDLPNPNDLRLDSIFDINSLVFNPKRNYDWLTNGGTVLRFDETLIGPAGQSGIQIINEQITGAVATGMPVNINPGSNLASDQTVFVMDASAYTQSGLVQMAGGMNIVGGAGFNLALEKNLSGSIQTGLSVGMPSFRSNKH
ncbi:hypothetical protein SAMN05216302_101960 [Nitrosomonas aestuarii]|uniref:Uncharacterized protein n=1 Tax=Nitrosomonas aestuarii TaxID=52441 RepID=A0A1I4D6P3_9PROT|nr:neuraminidase-like domain-containing protein [Nitrosomonas aestuarii]SFK89248.1 hypothetical protein SAMN05216302_101960 [Nitrosomonas aestuarii]